MKHVAFQLFLIKFDIWAFSVCVVLCMGMFSSLIEILSLDFHIAHMVIEINIFILSESLFVSFSKVRAANPQIWPRVMGSQSLSVNLLQIFLVVSHAWACLLLVHSSHMCCSVLMTLMFHFFLQKEQCTLLVWPRSLLQNAPHFILLVSMHLILSLIQAGFWVPIYFLVTSCL